jgi:hypothetical protein
LEPPGDVDGITKVVGMSMADENRINLDVCGATHGIRVSIKPRVENDAVLCCR